MDAPTEVKAPPGFIICKHRGHGWPITISLDMIAYLGPAFMNQKNAPPRYDSSYATEIGLKTGNNILVCEDMPQVLQLIGEAKANG